jgi:hypothetical protein
MDMGEPLDTNAELVTVGWSNVLSGNLLYQSTFISVAVACVVCTSTHSASWLMQS